MYKLTSRSWTSIGGRCTSMLGVEAERQPDLEEGQTRAIGKRLVCRQAVSTTRCRPLRLTMCPLLFADLREDYGPRDAVHSASRGTGPTEQCEKKSNRRNSTRHLLIVIQ